GQEIVLAAHVAVEGRLAVGFIERDIVQALKVDVRSAAPTLIRLANKVPCEVDSLNIHIRTNFGNQHQSSTSIKERTSATLRLRSDSVPSLWMTRCGRIWSISRSDACWS